MAFGLFISHHYASCTRPSEALSAFLHQGPVNLL